MFDEVECEIPLPGDGAAADRVFQTKSLHCALDRYTITQEGRLIHHFRRYERDPDVAPGVLGIPRMMPVDKQDIDTQFHGDIRMYRSEGDQFVDYVVRFTHGTLEWIRPLEELSEVERQRIGWLKRPTSVRRNGS